MIKRNSSPEKPQDIAAPNQESPSAYFRFTTKDGRAHGFPISQLLYFVLEANEKPSTVGACSVNEYTVALTVHAAPEANCNVEKAVN